MVILGLRGQIVDKIVKRLGLQTAVERTRFDLKETIQPIIDATPEDFVDIVRNISSLANSNPTIFTTPSDRDFFLTSTTVSFIKDATCNLATGIAASTQVVVNGNTDELCGHVGITLTVGNGFLTQTFNPPIKIDRGTTIIGNRGNAFTLGVYVRQHTITGFLRDPE